MVEIVVVSAHGGRQLLRDCLRSIECHPPVAGPAQVWVVDNASRDGTVAMVAREFPLVRLIQLPHNVGFAAANNRVLREACAPYVLLLNPDTELGPDVLDHALRALGPRHDVGALGVRLVRRDGSFDHAAKRQFPTILGALGHFSGLGRRAAARGRLAQYRALGVDEHGSGEVDAVNGAFMLIPREKLASVGLLDEGYHMYGEDLDWCYRAKQAGWRIWYEGTITVLHVKGGTSIVERGTGRHRPLVTNVAFHRSMGRFYRKFRGGENPLLDCVVYIGLALKLSVSVTRSTIARRRLL